MQPDQAGARVIGTRRSPIDPDRMAAAPVESRRQALDRLISAFWSGLADPVLMTGEPGSGKRWLARYFASGLSTDWRSSEVSLSTAIDGVDLLHLAADPIGLDLTGRSSAARLGLAERLRDESADGRSWLLILEEVQRASDSAWEEIEWLARRIGRPDGFAAMILLGRTELVRGLSSGRLRGWSGRFGLHIHLPPLDLDESRALLDPDSTLDRQELETIHRDARGNPAAMLRIAAARPVKIRERARPLPIADDPTATPRLPSLLPARPPIRVEEGLVEVGWEGDLEAEPTIRPDPASMESEISQNGPLPGEERVEDRYAALQAWAEWSRNRGRSVPMGSETPQDEGKPDETSSSILPSSAADEPKSAAISENPAIRVEPPHDFAPYSPIFGRTRHSL